MIESTFQHIPGVGEKTEKSLWFKGFRCWDDFIGSGHCLSLKNRQRIKANILESKSRLEDLDHVYFKKRLPPSLVWRAYKKFLNHACFIDIETTGLSPQSDYVTCVCVHTLKGTKSYVQGANLHELRGDLADMKYIVSFNGSRFDLPFLCCNLNLCFNQMHLDLMYPLHSLGFTGGLKKIEEEMGITRDSAGVGGFDAVRLWRAYRDRREIEVAGKVVGGEDALNLLIEYNRDDTINLKALADKTYDLLKGRDLKYNENRK